MQYQPDFLLMELPQICTDHLYIAGLIKKHPRFKLLPIIGYGDKIDEADKKRFVKDGISVYLERPLKFSLLLENIETLLKPQKKNIPLAATKSDEKKKQDLEKIMSPGTSIAEKIDTMVQYVTRLMAFPFTIAKVLHITNDEKSGASHIAKLISSDPAISANMLKVANSVFFSCADRRISSIKEAVVRVGFSETKNIVMGMMVPKMLSEALKGLGFDRKDFWQHSLAAALFSEKIAKFIGDVNIEMAFLAGLLHDLGVIILDEFFPEFFASSLKETSIRASHFPDEQTAQFGINHKDLVARLFPEWKIPPDITEAVVKHTDYALFNGAINTPARKLVFCVMLGNLLAKVAHFGRECDQFIWPVENWVFEQLRIGNVMSGKFVEDVHKTIVHYSGFLNLESRDYKPYLETGDTTAAVKLGIINAAEHVFIPIEIYLQGKGFSVERMGPTTDDNGALPNRFTMIIVWAGTINVTMESIGAYLPPVDVAGKQPPLLLIVDPGFNNAGLFPSDVSIMTNRFDLREFELALEKIRSGATVRATTPSPAPMPPLAK
jgi:putative nucleotidyltransferase with HDIG domain